MEETKKTAKRPVKKKQSNRKTITALVIFALLIFSGIVNLAAGGKGEVQKPKVTWKRILSGQYMEEYEEYRSESAVGKKGFRAVKSSLETAFGKRESNGVYRGKAHQLFEKIEPMDEKAVAKNAEAINEFDAAHYNIPTYVMLVPDAANIQSDNLPAAAVTEDQSAQFQKVKKMLDAGVTWVDTESVLKEHKDEKIYYDTDEHWTTLGASYGYEALASSMDLDASEALKLKSYVVNNNFNGSLSEKSGYESAYTESISIYSAKNVKDNTSLIMTNADNSDTSASLYDSAALKKGDKYALYPGADVSLLDIETTVDNSKRLLLVKDSFANCLLPFLAPHFREIVVIDPELYEGSVSELMQSKKFTHILFLYSGNSFMTTKSIEKILN